MKQVHSMVFSCHLSQEFRDFQIHDFGLFSQYLSLSLLYHFDRGRFQLTFFKLNFIHHLLPHLFLSQIHLLNLLFSLSSQCTHLENDFYLQNFKNMFAFHQLSIKQQLLLLIKDKPQVSKDLPHFIQQHLQQWLMHESFYFGYQNQQQQLDQYQVETQVRLKLSTIQKIVTEVDLSSGFFIIRILLRQGHYCSYRLIPYLISIIIKLLISPLQTKLYLIFTYFHFFIFIFQFLGSNGSIFKLFEHIYYLKMAIKINLILLALLPAIIYSLALSSSKLCAYNTLGFVPGDTNYTFSVINKLFTPTYSTSDFNVTWKRQFYPSHPFFNWIGLNNFRNEFQAMGCQIVPPSMFGNVCNYSASQVGSYYNSSFGGNDIVFKCIVPKNHFLMSVRFVPKINGWSTSAQGRWSVFRGIYKYNSTSEAKKVIKREGTKIFNKINSTKLNAYDVSTNLNILPNYTKGTLSYQFNNNIHTHYALNIKANSPQVLVDQSYIKILPPGTHFIAGAIYNGTTMVKQICDSFSFTSKDNCNLTL